MRRTRFWVTLALCVGVGLPLGLGFRSAFTPEVDRADSAIQMFAKYCIPHRSGVDVPLDPAFIQFPKPGANWTDPITQLTLDVSSKGCSVSDLIEHLDEQERQVLKRQFSALVAAEFPTLSPDFDHGLDSWDEFSLWVEYPLGDQRRWAASIARFAEDGDEAETVISIAGPRP